MSMPSDRRYTASHEWIREEGDGSYTLGVTDHAQSELGDLVFIELPEVGATFAAGAAAVVLESVKAAADVYAPCACTVAAINDELGDHPEHINEDPHTKGWMIRFSPDGDFDYAALLDAAAYEATL